MKQWPVFITQESSKQHHTLSSSTEIFLFALQYCNNTTEKEILSERDFKFEDFWYRLNQSCSPIASLFDHSVIISPFDFRVSAFFCWRKTLRTGSNNTHSHLTASSKETKWCSRCSTSTQTPTAWSHYWVRETRSTPTLFHLHLLHAHARVCSLLLRQHIHSHALQHHSLSSCTQHPHSHDPSLVSAAAVAFHLNRSHHPCGWALHLL